MEKFAFAWAAIISFLLFAGFIVLYYFIGFEIVNVNALLRQYVISLFVVFCISIYSLFRKS